MLVGEEAMAQDAKSLGLMTCSRERSAAELVGQRNNPESKPRENRDCI